MSNGDSGSPALVGARATGTASSVSSPTSSLNVIVLDRAVPRRGQAARRHRLRARSCRRSASRCRRQPVLRLPRLPARQEGGPRRRHRDALRAERAAHVHRRRSWSCCRSYLTTKDPIARLAGRARLVLHHRRDHAARRVRRAVRSASTRRARRCSARSPASRSPSSRCGRRSRCGRCRGSRSSRSRIVLIGWTANVRLPGGLPGGLAAVIVGHVHRLGRRPRSAGAAT